MNGAFSGQILAEKLAKLNSSQQSIETLSHWCIFHRKSARQVVEIWQKEFLSSPKEQRVPFLYLANDILQNSRRKGAEFVNEFWKVLPASLRDVLSTGDDSGRTTVLRLVDIWEERKVFGSHGQSLREELLGKDTTGHQSVKIKKEGAILEKAAATYKSAHETLIEEESAIEKCNAAINRIQALETEMGNHTDAGQANETMVVEELQQQHGILSHCIEQLESTEMARSSLVSQLREALQEQESKLERTRMQLQVAQAHGEQALSLQRRLLNGSPQLVQHIPVVIERPTSNGLRGTMINHIENMPMTETNGSHLVSIVGPLLASQAMSEGFAVDETKRFDAATAAAAEVAAKLAASTSSAAMLTSVLSSLTADDVASFAVHGQTSHLEPHEKRPRLGSPINVLPNNEVLSFTNQHQTTQSEHQNSSIQGHVQPSASHHSPVGCYMGPTMLGVTYNYQGQSHQMLGFQQVSTSASVQPLPPGCTTGTYQQGMGFYSQQPMPSSSAPIPRH